MRCFSEIGQGAGERVKGKQASENESGGHLTARRISNAMIGDYLWLMYMVTSKPKRTSLYSGVCHFMMVSSFDCGPAGLPGLLADVPPSLIYRQHTCQSR